MRQNNPRICRGCAELSLHLEKSEISLHATPTMQVAGFNYLETLKMSDVHFVPLLEPILDAIRQHLLKACFKCQFRRAYPVSSCYFTPCLAQIHAAAATSIILHTSIQPALDVMFVKVNGRPCSEAAITGSLTVASMTVIDEFVIEKGCEDIIARFNVLEVSACSSKCGHTLVAEMSSHFEMYLSRQQDERHDSSDNSDSR